jgi:hypothetical protein
MGQRLFLLENMKEGDLFEVRMIILKCILRNRARRRGMESQGFE